MARQSRQKILENCNYAIIYIKSKFYNEIFNSQLFKQRYLSISKKYFNNNGVSILGYRIENSKCYFILYFNNIENISKSIKLINLSFSRYFNKFKKQSGSIFDGRYKSLPLKSKVEILNSLAFVHSDFENENLLTSHNEYIKKESHLLDFQKIIDLFTKIPDIPLSYNGKFFTEDKENIEKFELVLREIVIRYHITSTDRLNDENLLYLIVKELKVRTQASLREIASRLNVNREKVRKLMLLRLN